MSTRITDHTQLQCAAHRPMNPRRHLLLLAILLLGITAPAARSQTTFIYALTEGGSLTVNATVLDKLSAKYDAEDPETFGEKWWDLLIDGADRYALRQDGRIQKNGTVIDQLPFTSVFDGSWVQLATTSGQLWALSNDGNLARDGIIVETLPREDFYFHSIVARGDDVFSMRSDGAIFRNTEPTALMQFSGGLSLVTGGDEGDPAAVDTHWRKMVVDPLDSDLYAIRNDGKVMRGDPDTQVTGLLVATLPFNPGLNTASQAAVLSEFYPDLTFLDDGTWLGLNGAGEVYEEGSHVVPLVNLPGGPANGLGQLYIGVLGGESFLSLRSDGNIYSGTETDPLVSLNKKNFRAFETSETPPDLTSFKNSRPSVTRTKATALEGESLTLSVLATDIEKTEAELTFTPDAETIPDGASWDAETRTLSWPNPGPVGKYTFKLLVDDGQTKPVPSKNKIVVKPLDANELKNRKPIAGKVKKVQALVGVPLSLPILATDLDGDRLVLSVDETKSPFTLGATFNPETRLFEWTPALEDLGKHKVVFFVSDGTATRKLSVKLRVIASLLGL
ncbi:MAG: putative Ig domain-containing protein [Planctomycetota bacterium]|jgi:hypothetical protein|nr:putative Ig domain-containing protein [Planctomycetota bacterium]